MTPLERRYRRVLRLLPADYRAVWEEDMVDTFLLSRQPEQPEDVDDPDFEEEFGRPDRTEVASVVRLAMRLRLGGIGAPTRSFARGEVVRRVALAGLLVHAVAAVVGVATLSVSRNYEVSALSAVWSLIALVWVGSYLALLAGYRKAAAWSAIVALVLSVLSAASDVLAGGMSAETATVRVLTAALPVLALAAFHGDAPPVRARPWLVALPVGAVTVTAAGYAAVAGGVPVLDWSGMLCLAVVAAGVTHLATGRGGPWPGALLVLAGAALLERGATLIDYVRFSAHDRTLDLLLTVGLAEIVAVAVVMTFLAVRLRHHAGHERVRT